jgi:hypothetical protein
MAGRTMLAKHFHGLTQISREEIFGVADIGRAPINLQDDAATMFAGYVGSKYQPNKGLLLLAINPGGGGDAREHRTPEDEIFYPKLNIFKRASPTSIVETFEDVNAAFVSIVQGWNLWTILEPTLKASGRSLDEVAFMNVIPYRTRNDKMPLSIAA